MGNLVASGWPVGLALSPATCWGPPPTARPEASREVPRGGDGVRRLWPGRELTLTDQDPCPAVIGAEEGPYLLGPHVPLIAM